MFEKYLGLPYCHVTLLKKVELMYFDDRFKYLRPNFVYEKC